MVLRRFESECFVHASASKWRACAVQRTVSGNSAQRRRAGRTANERRGARSQKPTSGSSGVVATERGGVGVFGWGGGVLE